MRLTSQQIKHFIQVIDKICPQIQYSLYLYGSRLHDELKGGDIDLAIQVDAGDKVKLEEKILDLLVNFKKNPLVGDRKIDLKIFNESDLAQDVFLQKISLEWIKLN